MGTTAPSAHFEGTIKALMEGRVVPFLGAGVNLCSRPLGAPCPKCARAGMGAWQAGKALPSGSELALYLARNFGYPNQGSGACSECGQSRALDLLRVAQYVEAINGEGPLYDELHKLLNADYPPTPVHRFFAGLPGLLRESQRSSSSLIIVTTNWDDVLERAFKEVGEAFDLVVYEAKRGEYWRKFTHRSWEGESQVIKVPKTYRDLPLGKRTIIVKIHGSVDRENANTAERRDSFVVTEDHYLDYLASTEISKLFPASLMAEMRPKHFLFLGYGLSDWNLRVWLRNIWESQVLDYKSWAVQHNPDELDKEFWKQRKVQIFDIDLAQYVAELERRTRDAGASGAAGGDR